MLDHAVVKRNKKEHLALTGLTLKEFKKLASAFAQAEGEAIEHANRQRKRQRQPGGGRTPTLYDSNQRLFFLLVYYKTYTLQVVHGKLFELSQPRTNHLIHELTPHLMRAFEILEVAPERDPKQVVKRTKRKGQVVDLIIDGTDRERQGPKNKDKQTLHYSGKQKTHTDKNIVLVNRKTTQIEFLSKTYAGTAHDKKIADHEAIRYPRKTRLFKDTGFQGYEPRVASTHQPQKSRVRVS